MRKANRDYKRIYEIGKVLSPLFDRIEQLRGRKEYLMQRLGIVDALIRAWGNERRNG